MSALKNRDNARTSLTLVIRICLLCSLRWRLVRQSTVICSSYGGAGHLFGCGLVPRSISYSRLRTAPLGFPCYHLQLTGIDTEDVIYWPSGYEYGGIGMFRQSWVKARPYILTELLSFQVSLVRHGVRLQSLQICLSSRVVSPNSGSGFEPLRDPKSTIDDLLYVSLHKYNSAVFR